MRRELREQVYYPIAMLAVSKPKLSTLQVAEFFKGEEEKKAEADARADAWAMGLSIEDTRQAGLTARQKVAEEQAHSQCHRIRDIFGNPFRPVTLDPTLLTATVSALAQAIYTDCNFTDLPILGDALEEAGCTSQDLLYHLRSPDEHVRGCWALDIILGKE